MFFISTVPKGRSPIAGKSAGNHRGHPRPFIGDHDPSGPGYKGRIAIEDAEIHHPQAKASKDDNDYRYKVPDINEDAFMGGAHPSASSWWYLHPKGIRKRVVSCPDGQKRDACEFIGERFRGRKFYYHQDPEACVK